VDFVSISVTHNVNPIFKRGPFMRKSLFLLFAVLAYGSIMSGCATIITGTSQEMSFQSNPDGATVTVSGRVIGKTPITTSLKKESNQSVIFEKEGYKTQTMQLTTNLEPWFWGNIVLGGLIGSTTDGLSGAVHEYSPSQYFISLPPAENAHIDPLIQRKTQAKDYIVLSYNNLMIDLSKGSGEYLNSLTNTLAIPENNKTEAISKIRALSEIYTDVPTFADRVIELYLK
jgi:hypothetical protein